MLLCFYAWVWLCYCRLVWFCGIIFELKNSLLLVMMALSFDASMFTFGAVFCTTHWGLILEPITLIWDLIWLYFGYLFSWYPFPQRNLVYHPEKSKEVSWHALHQTALHIILSGHWAFWSNSALIGKHLSVIKTCILCKENCIRLSGISDACKNSENLMTGNILDCQDNVVSCPLCATVVWSLVDIP